MTDDEFGAIAHAAAERFADHERMSLGRVEQWAAQFEDCDRGLVGKILQTIKYFSTLAIRDMATRLVDLVLQELGDCRTDAIVLAPVGEPSGGSSVIARALRDLKRDTKAPWRLVSKADLEQLDPAQVDAIVFFDDFSGTGDTLRKWWEGVEPLVLPKAAVIVVALLVIYHDAADEIDKFADAAICVEALDERQNALSPQSEHFTEQEQATLRSYCALTGVSERLSEGYGHCGLLVAFKHGCPNNSLPVLWCETQQWVNLFLRSAL